MSTENIIPVLYRVCNFRYYDIMSFTTASTVALPTDIPSARHTVTARENRASRHKSLGNHWIEIIFAIIIIIIR